MQERHLSLIGFINHTLLSRFTGNTKFFILVTDTKDNLISTKNSKPSKRF